MAEEKRILEEKLELDDEQAARNDEVYNGVFDLCRMLSENPARTIQPYLAN